MPRRRGSFSTHILMVRLYPYFVHPDNRTPSHHHNVQATLIHPASYISMYRMTSRPIVEERAGRIWSKPHLGSNIGTRILMRNSCQHCEMILLLTWSVVAVTRPRIAAEKLRWKDAVKQLLWILADLTIRSVSVQAYNQSSVALTSENLVHIMNSVMGLSCIHLWYIPPSWNLVKRCCSLLPSLNTLTSTSLENRLGHHSSPLATTQSLNGFALLIFRRPPNTFHINTELLESLGQRRCEAHHG